MAVPLRDYPAELRSKVDPLLYRRLEQLYNLIYELQQYQREIPLRSQQIVKQQLQLLGVLREPLVGQETPDPQLSTAATVPGALTDFTAEDSTNVTITVTNGNSTPHIKVQISDDPSFNSVNVTTAYKVGGITVVGAQGAAITDPTGGATIDAEARTAIIDILNFLRGWGAIA